MKQIRDLGYGSKSDKKQQARQDILVSYNDQMGPLRAKVYFTVTTKAFGLMKNYWSIEIHYMNWK